MPLGVCVVAAVIRLLAVPVLETVVVAVRLNVLLEEGEPVKEPVPVVVNVPEAVSVCDSD